MFEKDGVGEHYEIDPARNAIRYFRPIRLTAECLNCHGDPANSVRLWGNANGQDPTGGPMENWKVGEVHGAFEVVQSLDKADAQIRASMRNGLLVMAALVALSAMAFAFLMMRQVVRPFNHVVSGLASGAAEVAAVADQVSQASQTLAHGASEQAASLEQTSASMEQMAATTRQNAEHTSRAAGLMATVDQRVSASTRELESMVATMNAIKHSSGRVAQIIKTIDEIAFQTNILALNAAVEAARAGDAGSGFAVVADEVRTLAQRSAQAARDTADLIAEALDNATKGSARVRDLEASVRGITESVADVKQLVDNVSVASQEQAKGAAQVGQALHQMERVTQSNAAASEEGAASSEELSAQAEVARGLVEELRALMSGAQVGQSGDMERPGRSKRAA
jgi:methyl-accepting chemotaxis protein